MTVAARTSIGTGAEAPDRRPRYLVNPIVDALAVGFGSIAVYVLFRTRPGWAGSASVPSIAATLVWFANYPHFAATNDRDYIPIGWMRDLGPALALASRPAAGDGVPEPHWRSVRCASRANRHPAHS